MQLVGVLRAWANMIVGQAALMGVALTAPILHTPTSFDDFMSQLLNLVVWILSGYMVVLQ